MIKGATETTQKEKEARRQGYGQADEDTVSDCWRVVKERCGSVASKDAS